jgi:hypothetical protein
MSFYKIVPRIVSLSSFLVFMLLLSSMFCQVAWSFQSPSLLRLPRYYYHHHDNMAVAVASGVATWGTLTTTTTTKRRASTFTPRRRTPEVLLRLQNNMSNDKDGEPEPEYRNVLTELLSKFMTPDKKKKMNAMDSSTADAVQTSMSLSSLQPSISMIDWQAPKIPASTSFKTLAQALEYELIQSEWFVTGKVNPRYVCLCLVGDCPKILYQHGEKKAS